MADKNDLNQPGVGTGYLDFADTVRGHISKLWLGDYSGMSGLIAGMRRWVTTNGGNVQLLSRNTNGSESVLFDSAKLAGIGLDDVKSAIDSAKIIDSSKQAWENVSAQRSPLVTYTNTTGRLIIVNITLFYYVGGIDSIQRGADVGWGWRISGKAFAEIQSVTGNNINAGVLQKVVSFVVPNNASYMFDWIPLNSYQSRISEWSEYR